MIKLTLPIDNTLKLTKKKLYFLCNRITKVRIPTAHLTSIYTTHQCMIIPSICMNQVVAILTQLDRDSLSHITEAVLTQSNMRCSIVKEEIRPLNLEMSTFKA